jgi:hypothetical protein
MNDGKETDLPHFELTGKILNCCFEVAMNRMNPFPFKIFIIHIIPSFIRLMAQLNLF